MKNIKHTKRLLILLMMIIISKSYGQTFLNGNFEINTAVTDQINLINSQYNNFMTNSIAFGNYNGGGPNGGNMDIITSSSFCGSFAQSGNWYVCLTGGGTDAISLKLSAPLVTGNYYTISFYDRFGAPPATVVHPFQIGLSLTDTTFGSLIYTAPNADSCLWQLRTFTFLAPNNGLYVTVKISAGSTGDVWCHIDNFSISETTSIHSVNQNAYFKIFPNPASNAINISSAIFGQFHFHIYNSLGQLVKSGSTDAASTLSLDNFNNGLYSIELTSNNITYRQCFIVEK